MQPLRRSVDERPQDGDTGRSRDNDTRQQDLFDEELLSLDDIEEPSSDIETKSMSETNTDHPQLQSSKCSMFCRMSNTFETPPFLTEHPLHAELGSGGPPTIKIVLAGLQMNIS